MDVAVALCVAAALEVGLERIVFSYDINCKYKVNFKDRVTSGTSPLLDPNLNFEGFMTWLIGKFHLGGHKDDCSREHSFNYNKNVGRMSGELVETIWAVFNWLKWQTREMSWGARREALSDSMNDWNHQKMVALGEQCRS